MSTQENPFSTPGTININTVSTFSTLVISVTSSLHGGPSGSRSTDEPTDLNPTLRRVHGSTGPPTKRRAGHAWGEKSEPLRHWATTDCFGLVWFGLIETRRDVESHLSNLGGACKTVGAGIDKAARTIENKNNGSQHRRIFVPGPGM